MESQQVQGGFMSRDFNATGVFLRKGNFICLLALASIFIGCSPSVNQPVSRSLPYADSTTRDESHPVYRATRPIPVVIKPALPFRVSKLDNQPLMKAVAKNDILPVSAEIPAGLPQGKFFSKPEKN